jgi:Raf kinase inhibitor-like YbhB/YbcL family protein
MMKSRISLAIVIIVFSTLDLICPPFARGGENIVSELISPAFNNGGMIPRKYTCDGADASPPLAWDLAPEGTKSFAIICDDPDAPMGTWVHWIYYNIPPGTKSLPENIAREEHPDTGGDQRANDFNKIGYEGPCPPGGTHRYYFKLYALDSMLNLAPGATKKQFLKEIENHIIGQAQLMGIYKR